MAPPFSTLPAAFPSPTTFSSALVVSCGEDGEEESPLTCPALFCESLTLMSADVEGATGVDAASCCLTLLETFMGDSEGDDGDGLDDEETAMGVAGKRANNSLKNMNLLAALARDHARLDSARVETCKSLISDHLPSFPQSLGI